MALPTSGMLTDVLLVNENEPLGPITVSKKLVLAVAPPPSVTVRVTVDVPVWFGAGVSVTVRLEPLPPKKMFAFGSKVMFDDTAVTTRLVAGVSRSPTVKEIGVVGVLVRVVWLAMALMLGGLFVGTTTVNRKLVLAVAPPPSVTVNVTAATPL